MEEIVKLIGFSVAAALLCVVIKPHRKDFATALSIACGISLLIACCNMAVPVIGVLKAMVEDANIKIEYFEILMKAIGISYLAQFACDICSDAGEKAIAGKIELVSRFAIIIISMPLYMAVFELLNSLIG